MKNLPLIREALKFFATLLLAGQIAGCAPFYLINEEDRIAVMGRRSALVLLRVECNIDHQPYEPFPSSVSMDNITFGLGTFETVGEPQYVINRYLSDASRQAGWTFLLLPPGVYYLTIRPPQRSDWYAYEKMLKTGPRWRIDVPGQAQLIYVGTISLTGVGDPLLFGGNILRTINVDDIPIRNEQDLAVSLLTTHFPNTTGVSTILMQRWAPGDPIIIRSTVPPAALQPSADSQGHKQSSQHP
jgi:hypothetical protein